MMNSPGSLENQCDFDFIDDDLLQSDSTRIVNGQLVVGPMHYDTVCVSRNRYMADNTITKLEQFIIAGGKVLWFDNTTFGEKPKGTIVATVSMLPSILTPTIALELPNVNIKSCKRKLTNCSIYFVTNEDTCETSCTIQFNESLPIVQLDPVTGRCWIPSKAFRTEKGWRIPLELKFAGSCVFIFTNDPLPIVSEPAYPDKILQTISNGWTCRKTTEFVIGEHDMEVHGHPSEQPVNIMLGDLEKSSRRYLFRRC